MIVELFGLPGVGKSTYANQLVKESQYVRIVLNKKSAVLWWCLRALVRSPLLFFRHLAWCLTHNGSRFYIWNFFFVRVAKYSKAATVQGTALLDEGLLQNVLSLPNEKLDEKSINHFLNTIPDAGKVIIVSVAEEERQRRLQQRPYQTWRQKSDATLDYDVIMRHNHEVFLQVVKGRERFSLVDNT